LDAQERVLIETRGVDLVDRPSLLASALEGREVFVHLDCDVLDPSVMPARFEATGGLSDGGLRTLLTEVAEATSLIGCEITAFGSPELAARERLALLVDEGTWSELGIHAGIHFSVRGLEGKEAPADGVITGYGKIDGRLCAVAAYDFTVMAGSMGMTGEMKVARLRDLA